MIMKLPDRFGSQQHTLRFHIACAKKPLLCVEQPWGFCAAL